MNQDIRILCKRGKTVQIDSKSAYHDVLNPFSIEG